MPTKKRGEPTQREKEIEWAKEHCKSLNSVMRLKLAMQKTLATLGATPEEANQMIAEVRAADFTLLEAFLAEKSPKELPLSSE